MSENRSYTPPEAKTWRLLLPAAMVSLCCAVPSLAAISLSGIVSHIEPYPSGMYVEIKLPCTPDSQSATDFPGHVYGLIFPYDPFDSGGIAKVVASHEWAKC